jgi:hypothetical protein
LTIIFLLTDVHGLIGDLCLDPARPQLTALAQAVLRDCDSPYTPGTLLSALDQVITQLTHAIRDALGPIQPPPPPGARSKENSRRPTAADGAGSKENDGATWD